MVLSITDERVMALAREATHRTGLTLTGAVEQALTEYLARLPEGITDRAEKTGELVVEFNAGLDDDDRAAIRSASEDLYDETGLFR